MPTTEELQTIVSANNWTAVLPELLLGVLALALLAADAFYPRHRQMILRATTAAQGGILAYAVGLFLRADPGTVHVYFAGSLVQTQATELMRVFFLVCSLLVSHLGWVYLQKRSLPRTEFFHIVLVVTASLMLLVQAGNFVLFFVALETLTIGLFILVAFCRSSRFSLEAGLKMLITGAFSSGILLFGIVLLYGLAGNPLLPGTATDPLNFAQIGAFLGATGPAGEANAGQPLAVMGAVLILVGVGFKIGAVPFQIWIPDVYQGAPTPVTALLAVASKAGGFFVLYILLAGPLAPMWDTLFPALAVITGLTLLFGNIAPLGQYNVKRLMGLSGVAHAGVMLLGLLASHTVDWAFAAVLFYLCVYAVASFAVFEVMAHLAPEEDSDQDLTHYSGLMRRHPLLGGVFLVGVGSLAGIPPLAGFIAKALIFVAAFQAGLYALLVIALLGVVVSIYYYFGWMRAAVLREPLEDDPDDGRWRPQPVVTPVAKFVMVLLAVVTVVIGIYQAGLTDVVGLR
ncbi:MAG: NADH-quinone oxidoreductase subunit N [Opitutales bacterium]|nr:NADH-quinone oxidoreductase subunit N [Opitutales bacterium]